MLAKPVMAFEEIQPFPTITTKDLNGRSVTLPQDFPADPTLVLVAFKQRQQIDINSWIDGMELKTGPLDGQWIELPTIAPSYRPFGGWIDNGMRSGIPDLKDRARTITIYRNRRSFLRRFGYSDIDRVYAMVVTRNGEVLHIEPGRYTDEGAGRLLDVMTIE